jgi:TRAP-type C4-dicarboxylate transport system permease small subunit
MVGRRQARRAYDALELPVNAARRMCRCAAWFGGLLFILSSLLITIEIVLRKVFNSSTGGADELTGYSLASAAAWTFGYAAYERSHIRIDSLYSLMPARLQAVLDVLAIAALLLFFSLVLYFGAIMFADTVRIGTYSRTGLYIPLVIPQSVWIAGLAFSVAVTALLLAQALLALAAGDTRGVQKLVGSRSVVQELEDELAKLEARPTAAAEARSAMP